MTRPLLALLLASACAFHPAVAQAQAAPQDPAPDTSATPPPDKSSYTLFDPTPDANLRPLNTDRPAKGTSPVTVDAGHFQYETDLFVYTHSNAGGVSTRLYTAADPVLKLGVTHRLDLELQFNGYNSLGVFDPHTGSRLFHADGAGDLVIRAKLNLFGNESGPALALVPYVKLPTASPGIGNGQPEGGLIATGSYPLPYGFTLQLQPEVDILKNANDPGHHFSFTQLVDLTHAIGPGVTAFAELYSALGTDNRSPPVYTVDAAIAWVIGKNVQLDLGANIGLNRAAPNLQLYTGLSQRF